MNRLKKLKKCFKVSKKNPKLLKTHKTSKNALAGPTIRPTNKETYKVASTRLKRRQLAFFILPNKRAKRGRVIDHNLQRPPRRPDSQMSPDQSRSWSLNLGLRMGDWWCLMGDARWVMGGTVKVVVIGDAWLVTGITAKMELRMDDWWCLMGDDRWVMGGTVKVVLIGDAWLVMGITAKMGLQMGDCRCLMVDGKNCLGSDVDVIAIS